MATVLTRSSPRSAAACGRSLDIGPCCALSVRRGGSESRCSTSAAHAAERPGHARQFDFQFQPARRARPDVPWQPDSRGRSPVPPEDSPQAGGCVAESPATAARGRDRMDVRQAVTDRIIAMLDKGGSVFRERWTRAAARGVPRNGKTGASAGCPRSRPVASESCCRIAGSQPQCADRRTVVKTGSPRAYLVEGARPD